ncbi:16S rRNA (uracil(1498)-N(3))-methyltransferase [Allonocardiopsis opalescens]|uniref:Ribosomal RNA small subunit methyltransferase E n=1 Tax=Allonocardiopsis opalescens TaxID=1144618 RepID=A0A2T0QFI8_9ACTN|nr:16S rRNA (uracil(1498)-N(3))-methyltransferase [Allonocardiopsis opalescens]PRY02689.1 16S rRNA (uracil1498-N3)-methyltransferase [Allonocardiopsis opalescens]
MSAPVFVVDGGWPDGDRIVLSGAEGHHAARVRRIAPGERADLTDGAGRVAHCAAREVGRSEVVFEVLDEEVEPAPRPSVTVVQALPKGDRGERAVELMSEAGVDAVVPWTAQRCVTQWRAERGGRALERWRSTAREAGKQARRRRFLRVREPAGTPQVVELLAAADFAAVLHESAVEPLSTALPADAAEVVLVVGPEGGVTDAELAAFAAVDAHPVRLGPTVLRTSTAGLAGAAVVFTRTGRW